VTGRLHLNGSDPEDFLYAVKDARVEGWIDCVDETTIANHDLAPMND
jgi:hypothetical protein